MIYRQILVFEVLAINRNRSRAVALEDVATLHHEVVDDAMEARSIVRQAIDALETDLAKVAHGFRCIVAKKPESDAPQRLSAVSYVEIYLRCHSELSAVLANERKR